MMFSLDYNIKKNRTCLKVLFEVKNKIIIMTHKIYHNKSYVHNTNYLGCMENYKAIAY